MNYLRLLIIATLVAQGTYAQRTYVGLFGGAAAYNGDLTKNMFPKKVTNGAIGINVNYDLTNHITLKSGFTYTIIGGSDRYSNDPGLISRNLSFETSLCELSAVAEYNLFNQESTGFSPYAFAGLAFFKFNPYAYDLSGQKIFLQPLNTEGQGLSAYPDRKPYSLVQFAIPFGGGIKIKATENIRLGFEVGLRKLFFEYLDDVSTAYVDWETLRDFRGQTAVDMAFRGDELDPGFANSTLPYPSEGTQRGDPSSYDTYYFTGINLTYRLNSGKGGAGYGKYSGRKSRLGCPANVY